MQNYAGLYDELGQDYTFTSYRKWFPVPDGACVIWRNGETYQTLSPQSEEDRTIQPLFSKYKFAGNVLKNYRDIVGDEICLKLLEKGEEILESEEACRALAWTERTMMKMEISGFLERRRKNAEMLHQGLEAMEIPHLYQEDATPLFVPVLLHKNRDKVRKVMFQQSVFCPIHWGEEWKKAHKEAGPNRLAEMELSLICDQRYGEKEMQRQLEILQNECAYS